MSNQKLNDILTYLETRIVSQIPELSGKVKVTRPSEPYPGSVQNYGVRIYLGSEKPKEIQYRKIGPIATEIWRINVDFIYNRDMKSRELYSDSKGLSYWENLLTASLIFENNSEAFQNSVWEFVGQENENDATILKGIFTCEIQNRYT
jgi:hypothetical protein